MVLAREANDLVRATARIVALAEDERRPYDAIRRWLGIPVRPRRRA
jgi:hypothetical protein